jgi:membrane protease YdiL (CAAX protease family)
MTNKPPWRTAGRADESPLDGADQEAPESSAQLEQAPDSPARPDWPKPPWTIFDMLIAFIGGRQLGTLAGSLWQQAAPPLVPHLTAPVFYGIKSHLWWGVFGLVAWGILRYRSVTWSMIGLGRPPWRAIALMPLIAVALFAVEGAVAVVLTRVFGGLAGPANAIVPVVSVSFLFNFASSVIWAPVVEEIVFRGLVYRWLRGRLAMVWTASVTSVLFALIHVPRPVPLLVPYFILGFVMAISVERTRSLYPAITLHGSYNLVALLLNLAVAA